MADDSKTEKATSKKRRDERKEGNVFQSTDVVSVVFVLVAFLSLQFIFPIMHDTIVEFTTYCIFLVGNLEIAKQSDISAKAMDFVIAAAICIIPFGLICMTCGVLLHGIQTKFLFVAKQFYPKFNRLSPLQGIKKLFSLKSVVELIKNLIKVSILATILYTMLIEYIISVVRTMDMSIHASVGFVFELCMNIVFRVTIIFAFIAFFDYLYQKWEYERNIRMSKQEIKEEYKQMEGDPQIKGKIREMQRQRAMSRMMQAVPNADVIIRNPTHFAVALVYDKDKSAAPIVVAKGQDELALRIIQIGEENNVVIVENKPLARAIYAETELNHEIPAEYYGAVAEILVYVYKLNNKMR